MIIENDEIIFSSGRHEYCFLGIIGISLEGELSYGLDGGFVGEDDEGLSNEEQIEIADYMVGKWQHFKDSLIRVS